MKTAHAIDDKVVELVELGARARLPSRFGEFDVYAFQSRVDGKEHAIIARGELSGARDVPVRIHSECFTGDVMGSLRCDCRDQLEAALEYVAGRETGAVVYMRQEGRGIGLVNKIKAYALQEQGLDTVEANQALGFPDDLRRYDVAAAMLRLLGVDSVRLITNNPRKVDGLRAGGIAVAGRIPHIMPPNPHNAFYLATKREKSGHLL
ncbi:MAG: GTP cyclohydrolase II [Alphaproteobacteria bacterium]|nr:GTP cyclohydrolase II [Alphaproteobacteria bacterium]